MVPWTPDLASSHGSKDDPVGIECRETLVAKTGKPRRDPGFGIFHASAQQFQPAGSLSRNDVRRNIAAAAAKGYET